MDLALLFFGDDGLANLLTGFVFGTWRDGRFIAAFCLTGFACLFATVRFRLLDLFFTLAFLGLTKGAEDFGKDSS